VKLKAWSHHIVVRRDEAPKKKGGIFLPETTRTRSKPITGTVVDVGPLVNAEVGEAVLKRGDRIVFLSFAGTEVQLGGEVFLVILDEDVIAIIEGENADAAKDA